MNCDLECALRRAYFGSQRRIGCVGLIEQKAFQPIEMIQASMLHELSPQLIHDFIEHRERPASLEDALGRFSVRRVALISLFPGRDLQRQNVPAAALQRAAAVALVSEEE